MIRIENTEQYHISKNSDKGIRPRSARCRVSHSWSIVEGQNVKLRVIRLDQTLSVPYFQGKVGNDEIRSL